MESHLMNTLMQFANEDERIKSVILGGSRANPNAQVDDDSDYDVMLGVSDLQSFRDDDQWLNQFGDILILQRPESIHSEHQTLLDYKEVYLVQFKDGSRIDVTLLNESLIQEAIEKDSLSTILLDKTSTLVAGEANDSSYHIKNFILENCVNEFLWLSFYATKGQRRNQLMYTQNHLNMMREELLNLVAYQHGGNPGAHYKYAEKFLNAYELSLFKGTFSNDIQNALKVLFEIFGSYLKKEDFDMTQFEEVRYVIESHFIN